MWVSYSEKLEKLSKAISWINSQIKVDLNSRFMVYQKIWMELIESSDLPDKGISPNQFNRMAEKYGESALNGAILETDELTEIYDVFHLSKDLIPKSILEKIVKGKLSEVEEIADKPNTSEPRNFLFELTCAAKLYKSGFNIKLSEDADVVFNFRNYKVFIECKRIYGEKNFESNFRKANEQLVARYKKHRLPKNLLGTSPIGMCIISLTKALNSNQLFLYSNSKTEAVTFLDTKILEYVNKYNDLILRKIHANTIGVGFYIRTPVILPSGTGELNRWLFFPQYENQHKLRRVFDEIGKKSKFNAD